MNRKTLLVPILILAVVLISVSYLKFLSLTEPDEYIENEKVFKSNISNITFPIPEGWQINNELTINHPLLNIYDVPEVIMEETVGSCVILKTNYREDWLLSRTGSADSERVQVSFADRIMSDYAQFDGNWYVEKTAENSDLVFSGDERQYLSGEIRVSTWRASGVFILLDKDGQAVSDTCNSTFNNLLESVTSYYEDVVLTENSRGHLQVAGHSPRVGERYTYLEFIDIETKERKLVARLPNIGYGENTLVLNGDDLYLAGNSSLFSDDNEREVVGYTSALYKLNIFSGKLEEVPYTEGDLIISSLIIKNGNIYYLRGEPCLGYGPCDASLFKISLSGGEPELLLPSLRAGRLIGISTDEQTFYIEKGFGDAGFFHVEFIATGLNSGEKTIEIVTGNSMEEETDMVAVDQKLADLRATYSDRQNSPALYLENGIVVSSDVVTINSSRGTFVVMKNEI